MRYVANVNKSDRSRPPAPNFPIHHETTMITMFVHEWLRLCAYCKSEHFDKGIFMSYHDNYEKAWKKLDFAQQGEISYRLSQLTQE